MKLKTINTENSDSENDIIISDKQSLIFREKYIFKNLGGYFEKHQRNHINFPYPLKTTNIYQYMCI